MPIPDSLRAELAQYLIGQKLRALRLRRSMGLTQLGQRTGLSPALLSKIENGKLVPTIPTLLRIATVFDVTLDHFFQNEHRRRIISITRRQDRDQAPEHRLHEDGYSLVRLDLGSGERKFQPFLAEFCTQQPDEGRPHMHQGFEFIHVLTGTLELMIGSDKNVLGAGDSVYFDSNLRHAYRSVGEVPCVALMVLAYPERNLSERRMSNLGSVHAGRHPAPAMTPLNGSVKIMKQPVPAGEDPVSSTPGA